MKAFKTNNFKKHLFTLLTIVALTQICSAKAVVIPKSIKEPGQLTSFYAFSEKNYVLLQWNITDQENFNHFVLERSADGTNFKDVALVFAKEAGESTDYNYKDKISLSTGSKMFYRIRMVNKSGEVSYSFVRPVRQYNDQETIAVNSEKSQLKAASKS